MLEKIRTLPKRPWFGDALFVLFLLLLVSLLAFVNYTPGTWLSGWDNLHPELYFWVNIKRSLFASWQEYQSLGLLGGMAHASDLPRQLILWVFSLVLPNSVLRYVWVFLMLFLGPLGVFLLINQTQKKQQNRRFFSTGAALFYLCNIAVIQMFYEPFDAYVSFYGFFPLIIWSLEKVFEKSSKKNWLLFCLVSFLGSPLVYVSTVFVVELLVLGMWMLIKVFWAQKKRAAFLTAIQIGIVLLIIHSYWLFSFVYFVAHNTQVPATAKANLFATYDTFLQNKEYGSWENVFRLRGYWLSFHDVAGQGTPFDLMPVLKAHAESDLVDIVSWGFVIVVWLAMVTVVLKKLRKKKVTTFEIGGISLFFLCWLMLGLDNPPFGFLYTFLLKVPFFEPMFRTAFTKWIFVMVLAQSILFGLFWQQLYSFLVETLHESKKLFAFILGGIIFGTLLFVTLPMWTGHLIDQRSRTNLPEDYFQVISFFKQQDTNTRIANFPQISLFGWQIIDDVYRGSGFLWYGVEQPILDRAFDVWSSESEAYYNQMHAALYGENLRDFEQVVKKYDIDWLLVDKNYGDSPIYAFETLQAFAKESDLIDQPVSFGKIDIYPVKNDTKAFVEAPNELVAVEQGPTFSYTDPVKKNVIESVSNSIFVPFWNLTERSAVGIESDQDSYSFTRKLPDRIDQNIHLTSPFETETELYAQVWMERRQNRLLVSFRYLLPQVETLGKKYLYADNTQQLNFSIQNGIIPKFLQINDRVMELYFDDLGEMENTLLGEVAIRTQRDNYISFFEGKGQKYDLTGGLISANLENCWQTREDQKLENYSTADEIRWDGQKIYGCVTTTIDDFGGIFLADVSLETRSKTGLKPNYQLLDESGDTYYRFNNRFSKQSTLSQTPRDEWSQVRELVPFGFEKERKLSFELALDAFSYDSSQEIEYRNVGVQVYPEIMSGSFAIAEDIKAQQPVVYDSQVVGQVAVTVPKTDEWLVDSSNFYSLANQFTNNTCANVNDDFSFDREIGSDKYRYSSYSGHNCDYLYAGDVWTNRGYVLEMTHQNIEGRSFELCLVDPKTSICQLKTKLTQGSDQPVTDSYVVSPRHGGNLGYRIFFNNYGIGTTRTMNDLYKIELYPIMYNYLQSIVYGDFQKAVVTNKLEVNSVKKVGTMYYDVRLENEEGGWVVLDQSYHQGWIAFDVENPFSLLPHHKVNGWANGWYVPRETNEVVLFFWPQLLTFAGYGLAVCLGLFFVAWKER